MIGQFKCISLIVTLLFSSSAISSDVEIKELLQKGAECRNWSKQGDMQMSLSTRPCLITCEQYGNRVAHNLEQLTPSGVEDCRSAYARTKQKMSGLVVSPVQTPSLRVRKDNPAAPVAERVSMPDVVGVWTGNIKSRVRIRSDSRQDWQKICRGLARVNIFTYSGSDTVEVQNEKARLRDAFYKKIKPKDRVQLVGVTYEPDSVGRGGKRFHCLAERIVIL